MIQKAGKLIKRAQHEVTPQMWLHNKTVWFHAVLDHATWRRAVQHAVTPCLARSDLEVSSAVTRVGRSSLDVEHAFSHAGELLCQAVGYVPG